MRKLILLLTSVAFIASCNFAAKYKRPDLDLPDQQDLEDYSVFTQQKWWSIFNDDTLNKLEDTALSYNNDLLMAMARVDQARADAGVVTADSKPAVAASAAGLATGGSAAEGEAKDYSAGLAFSYELDLWGKYRNLNQAARARLLQSEAQRDVVRLTLTADVAKAYFTVRTLDSQIATTQRTLDARQETVRIYKTRYENGLVGELDLRRMEAERDSVQASLIELQKTLSQNETALSVLIGGSPRQIVENKIERGKELAEITIVPNIPAEVPSNILENRPDIRVAEYQLVEANANIGVARAAYFPDISLTASGGIQSASLTDLFSGGLWNFAANLSGPIFEGGKIKAQVEEYSAKERELVANYQKTVQNAFKETYDAIVANRLNRQSFNALHSQSKALNRSLDLVKKQYDAGLVSMLDVLDVERNFLQAQIDEASAMQNELNAVVAISKALGGGLTGNSADNTLQIHESADAKTKKADLDAPAETTLKGGVTATAASGKTAEPKKADAAAK
ncbi:MAG: efflux transporter outer membrane subunit [Elusimicrobiota bacterium]|jgi:multidrug efflux system outer membrane protein|nr:efflux transporter outer membrane subunit [Elusimicrobiota bacterium]